MRGSELIIHAGDVGAADILEALGQIAPVIAVRGNVDTAPWATALHATEVVEREGHSIYVLHDLAALDLNPAAAGFSAVITGHSHVPKIEDRQGVLFLNPGSAGPRRFRLPVSVARISLAGDRLRAEIVELKIA